jgi:uncharacterized delta-60 repeat protein
VLAALGGSQAAQAQPPSQSIIPAAHTTTSFGVYDVAHAVATQSDGRIVAGGYTGETILDSAAEHDFALARYLPDGQLDQTFGTDGRVATDFGADRQVIYDLAVLPDDRILAAGIIVQTVTTLGGTDWDLVVARYTADGQLDASFGPGGHVALDLDGGENDHLGAIAVQPDGRIVLAGTADDQLALVRLAPDGQLDPSFGRGGVSIAGPAARSSVGEGLVVGPDGAIVVVGSAKTSGSFWDMVVVRFDALGLMDSAFGPGGVAILSLGHTGGRTNGLGGAVDLMPDGRIVATGSVDRTRRDYDFHVARLLPDGSLDPSFAGSAHANYDVHGQEHDFAQDMVLRPDGGVFVAGWTFFGSVSAMGLALHLPNGALDARFGNAAGGGRAIVMPPAAGRLLPHAAAPLAGDQVVVVGGQDERVGNGYVSDFAVTIVDLPPAAATPSPTATPMPTASPTPVTPPSATWTPTPTATPTPVGIYLPAVLRRWRR